MKENEIDTKWIKMRYFKKTRIEFFQNHPFSLISIDFN